METSAAFGARNCAQLQAGQRISRSLERSRRAGIPRGLFLPLHQVTAALEAAGVGEGGLSRQAKGKSFGSKKPGFGALSDKYVLQNSSKLDVVL